MIANIIPTAIPIHVAALNPPDWCVEEAADVAVAVGAGVEVSLTDSCSMPAITAKTVK